MSRLRFVLMTIGLALVASFGLMILLGGQSKAADAHEFKAGNIISDAVFYDSNSMTTSQVQRFLESKMPNCDTDGSEQTSYYYNSDTGELHRYDFAGANRVTTSRAVYGQRYNNWNSTSVAATPFTCLRDYRQDTRSTPSESGLCGHMNAYQDATAAQIITRVADACGVSPKALIVLLEKEQSLVTDDWPWKDQYQKATGYACPDDAPCDTQYYGFFNQVYSAAWQFKKYRLNPHNYGYVAGQNNFIQYNPNDSCGGKWIYIQNQATAGLYNYTPYIPNEAALDAGYGTGNSCSAYGNRNFFLLFTDWFGSTTYNLHGAIEDHYVELGAEKSFLGYPTSNEIYLSDGGRYQKFEGGRIYWSNGTGAWSLHGAVESRYLSLGAEKSRLGYPISEEVQTDYSVYQRFENGYILWQRDTGAWETLGPIRDRYVQLGVEYGILGHPTSGQNCNDNNTTCYQRFENGYILWQRDTGAWETLGPIRERYGQLGVEHGSLGYPIGGQNCTNDQTACYQRFENGYILWQEETGAWETKGAIRDRYAELGVEHGTLGYPTGGEIHTDSGVYQRFENGYIIWKSSTGAWETLGPIRERYEDLGVEHGTLGYPTGGLSCSSEITCYQRFENGYILWQKDTGAWETLGAIRDRYAKLEVEHGWLGYPTSGENPILNGGRYQQFEHGRIYWSSKTGAWSVHDSIGSKYLELDAEKSFLGYPTRNEIKLSDGGRYQQFEHGRIYWSSKTGAWSVHGAIETRYLSLGAKDSRLGYPLSGEIPNNDGGVYQTFQAGVIHWKNGDTTVSYN